MKIWEKDRLLFEKLQVQWKVSKKGIEVYLFPKETENLDSVCFPWFWLRDHCQCSSCFTSTAQREYDIFIEWDKLKWEEILIDTDSAGFLIQWGDNHTSYFSYNWLWEMLNIEKVGQVDERRYWSKDFPIVEYENVLNTDAGLMSLLEALAKFGVCKVVGAKPHKEQASQLMHRISYLRQSIFGEIREIKPSSNSEYNEAHIHTDGAFNYDPPGVKLVQCLEENYSPREMIFADGLALVDRMKHEVPQVLELLQNSSLSYQYMRGDVNLLASEPIAVLDRQDRLKRVRYNPKIALPLGEGDLQKRQTLQMALQQFKIRVEEESQQKKIFLNPGEMVLWDNWRVLHGGSSMDGTHHIAVCWLNMEDFHSRLRVNRSNSDRRPVPQSREKGIAK